MLLGRGRSRELNMCINASNCLKMVKNQLSQVIKYFAKCVFHASGSQYKPSFLQFLQDPNGRQSHLDQLPEKSPGNPQPIPTNNWSEKKNTDCSPPVLSLCSQNAF